MNDVSLFVENFVHCLYRNELQDENDSYEKKCDFVTTKYEEKWIKLIETYIENTTIEEKLPNITQEIKEWYQRRTLKDSIQIITLVTYILNFENFNKEKKSEHIEYLWCQFYNMPYINDKYMGHTNMTNIQILMKIIKNIYCF